MRLLKRCKTGFSAAERNFGAPGSGPLTSPSAGMDRGRDHRSFQSAAGPVPKNQEPAVPQNAATACMNKPASRFPKSVAAMIAAMKTSRSMSTVSDRTCPSDLSMTKSRITARNRGFRYSAAAMELMTEEI
jgi:hypothetical protein